jgi:hypothetical protein
LPEGKIAPFRFAVAQSVKCMNHKKEARYGIYYYEKEKLVIVRCLSCPPDSEVCRFNVADKEIPA